MRNVNRRHNNGAAIAAPAAPATAAAAFVAVAALLLLIGPKSALSSPLTNGDAGNGLQQEQEVGEGAVQDEPPDPQLGKLPNNNNGDAMAQQPSHQHIQLPSKNVQPHASFLTMDKRAHLSGIRIEPEEPGEEAGGFIGYNEKGVSIVAPHTPVRVVLFGSFLDDIALVGFTPSENCSQTLVNIHQEDFTIQTERRIVIIYEFEESKSIYKICLKQKVGSDVYELPFSLVDDLRCSVSTDMPPRKYYFPIAVQISIVFALLVLSGLFSGLNLGLMSLTPQELTLISNSGSPKERKYAQTILPVRKSGNLLLCSLLIGNVCVNSAISILFDDLTSGYVALVVSSAGIVVFGEIFPQALCVKKGLAVGAHTIWVTRFFMVLTFPLAYPISRVLDYLLGDEVVSYDRKRLMELIKLSTKNAIGCPAEELKIAIGAFEMGDKTVKDVMTKIDDVFMIPQDTVLNAKVVAEILRSGYTRIPIYTSSRDNVVSLLFVKDLALLDPDDNFVVKTVCDYYQHPVRRVPENTPLRSMLEEFKKGDYHMALVDRLVESTEDKDTKYELVGLVTLEDIVEEILQAEIVDETDVVTDNVHRTRRRKNHRRDLDLFIDDGGACQISMQMQLVTIQYLEGNFRAFSPDRIAQSILEKVIRAHVHKVEVSHLTDLNDPKTALPRKAKLYTKKQTSDKFVLILEGRALVTIGQNEMTFEVGPWQCFGTELLNQLDQLIDMVEQQQSSAGNSLSANAVTQTTIKTVTSAAGAIDRLLDGVGGGGAGIAARISHGALPGIMPATSVSIHQQQPLVDLIGQDAAKKVKFVPDYSVKILSECTYLEISVQTYLAMYRSTLITRNKDGVDGPIGGGTTGGGLPSNHVGEPAQIGTTPSTAAATPQHNQQHFEPDPFGDHPHNLVVDSDPVVISGSTPIEHMPPHLDGPKTPLGNGAVVGDCQGGAVVTKMGKRRQMENPNSTTRHRRTNSDTMTGLLSNGPSRKSMDGGDEQQHNDEAVRDAAVGTDDDEATLELLDGQQRKQEKATKPSAAKEAIK